MLLRPATLAAAAVLPAAVADDSKALTVAVQQSEVQLSGALVVTAANGSQQVRASILVQSRIPEMAVSCARLIAINFSVCDVHQACHITSH